MGHIRLGALPKTHRWKQVIELLIEGGDVPEIADSSLLAIQRGLKNIPDDPGFIIALTNIFKFIEAARSKDYLSSLTRKEFSVEKGATLFDFLGNLRSRTDRDLESEKVKSDLSELIQNSFSEAMVKYTVSEVPTLFETTPKSIHNVLRKELNGKSFTNLMHEFYSGFVNKYLSYYLSRELPLHVGPGERFQNITEHKDFNSSFELYIRQSVRITKEFTPGWLGKAIYEKDLSYNSVSRYAHVAFKKITSEFGRKAQKSD